ncbi:M24 family metallopeptidase [Calderihabitans maritimus]|uniref:Peptidase M24 n=1 Tax=Calderihabitans maritimus TaxID=1246530 RepID=A0A1Z5HUF2_9FIRM|nr:Xaa-Pro peptidase family protein [Calderihabitans maritimus]GAW92977.1 hypothetical protein KKC1_21220 [Calderihabitans maritimus]
MLDRLRRLQSLMQDHAFTGALLMHPRDVYYYAGTAQPCNLFVPQDGEPILFIRRAWDFVKKETFLPAECQVDGGSLRVVKQELERRGIKSGTIGITEDVLPALLYNKIKRELAGFLFKNISPLILEQRMVKDVREIEAIKKTAALYKVAHQAIMENLRDGITELELASRVLGSLRACELEGIVRNRRWDASLHPDGIIAAGENCWEISGSAMTVTGIGLSPSLAWGASTKVIREGELVVIDIPLNRHGYHADIARTYVAGRANSRQKEIFEAVLEIQDRVIREIRPGVKSDYLYNVAESTASELGYLEYFQGYGRMKGKYIGHGVGLENDEPPTLDPIESVTLQAGMVLAIEPKFIIPGWGAVDIEDTVLVTEKGAEILTPVERKLFEVIT